MRIASRHGPLEPVSCAEIDDPRAGRVGVALELLGDSADPLRRAHGRSDDYPRPCVHGVTGNCIAGGAEPEPYARVEDLVRGDVPAETQDERSGALAFGTSRVRVGFRRRLPLKQAGEPSILSPTQP